MEECKVLEGGEHLGWMRPEVLCGKWKTKAGGSETPGQLVWPQQGE